MRRLSEVWAQKSKISETPLRDKTNMKKGKEVVEKADAYRTGGGMGRWGVPRLTWARSTDSREG